MLRRPAWYHADLTHASHLQVDGEALLQSLRRNPAGESGTSMMRTVRTSFSALVAWFDWGIAPLSNPPVIFAG